MSFSKKGQSPFIVFNGEQFPDSNMIVTYLSKYFGKDPFPDLSQVDRAIGRAFIKMLEENTAWWVQTFSKSRIFISGHFYMSHVL